MAVLRGGLLMRPVAASVVKVAQVSHGPWAHLSVSVSRAGGTVSADSVKGSKALVCRTLARRHVRLLTELLCAGVPSVKRLRQYMGIAAGSMSVASFAMPGSSTVSLSKEHALGRSRPMAFRKLRNAVLTLQLLAGPI